MQINKTIKNGESGAFSELEHEHDNPVANLEYARVSMSIIAIIYDTTRSAKCTHLQVISQQNTQNI